MFGIIGSGCTPPSLFCLETGRGIEWLKSNAESASCLEEADLMGGEMQYPFVAQETCCCNGGEFAPLPRIFLFRHIVQLLPTFFSDISIQQVGRRVLLMLARMVVQWLNVMYLRREGLGTLRE